MRGGQEGQSWRRGKSRSRGENEAESHARECGWKLLRNGFSSGPPGGIAPVSILV